MAKVIILYVDVAECSGGTQANAQDKNHAHLRWPNTVYARFTDSASDAIKRALGLW